MKSSRSTVSIPAARSLGIMRTGEGAGWSDRRARIAAAVLMAGAAMLGGCVSVSAPDKPIVIELNINIKQEVIYRLAEDVKQNIEANPDIF